MRKAAIALLATAGVTAWGQVAPKVDRATAYYNYTLAHMYAEMAANNQFRGDNTTKAIEYYKAAIKAVLQTPAIAEELSEFYIQSLRIAEAQKDAEDALRQNPNDISALRLLARIYTRQIGQSGRAGSIDEAMLKKAIEEYLKITALDAKDTDSWLMLGRLYSMSTNSVEAEKSYKKALDSDPDNEDALTGLAIVYSGLGDNQKAAELLKHVADKNPSSRSLQTLAQAYESMKEFSLAADALKHAAELDPENSGDLSRAQAKMLLAAERYNDALDVYKQLVEDEPSDAQSYLVMSQIYLQQKDFAKAREASDKARSIEPDNIQVRSNDVVILEAEDKLADAAQTAKDILAATVKRNYTAAERRDRINLLDRMAGIYRTLDQTDAAVDAFRQIADLDNEAAPQVAGEVIETYRNSRLYAKAQQEAEAALKKWPDNLALRIEHATVVAEQGKIEPAIAEVKKAYDNKNDYDMNVRLAEIYDKGRKFDEMSKALDTAEKQATSPEQKENIWFMRGAMFEKMKRQDQSEAEFRKVLQVDPGSAAALNYLGYMLANRNVRLPEALEMINKAVEKQPNEGAYLDSLGWIYFRLGRLTEAESTLRRAIQRTPRDPTVHDHMAEVLMRESKLREAVAQWEISLKEWELSPPSELEPAERDSVKKKLESARVQLAKAK